jgi:hypothetical protein
MTDREALQAVAHGGKVPQTNLMRLWREGLVELVDATKLGSTEPEYLPSFITIRGKKMLEN